MKSPRRIHLVLTVLIVLILAASPMAFGQMGMMGGPQRPGPKGPPSQHPAEPFSLESYKERLGLTEEQAEKFAKVRSDYRKEVIKKRAEIQVAAVELSELLDQKKVDLNQVEKKLRQVEGLKTDLTLYRIKTLFKTKEFLSEDQFEKLKSFSFRMMRHGMMPGRMGRGMMGPDMMGRGMMGQGMMGQGMMGDSGMAPSEEEE